MDRWGARGVQLLMVLDELFLIRPGLAGVEIIGLFVTIVLQELDAIDGGAEPAALIDPSYARA